MLQRLPYLPKRRSTKKKAPMFGTTVAFSSLSILPSSPPFTQPVARPCPSPPGLAPLLTRRRCPWGEDPLAAALARLGSRASLQMTHRVPQALPASSAITLSLNN